MKSKTIFFAIIMLMVSQIVYADWQIQFDSEADRVMHMGGDTLRGNFATKGQCQSYQNSRPAFEQNHSWCVGYDRSSSGSTDTPSGYHQPTEIEAEEGNTASEAEQQQTGQEQAEQERAKKERQEAFDRAQNELRMGLKGGTSTGVPGLKTGTTALPLKGSGNSQSIGLKKYDAAAKEKTIKAIKELNCSAYWGLNSAKAALDGKNEVTKKLDDKYTLARKYGEYSAMAKDGKSVSGCPEVKISVPDVPPPVEANPQIQLYKHIIQQTEILVPDIIETQQKIEDTKQRLKNTKKDIADKRQEIEQFDKKLRTTKKEEEKDTLKKNKEEIDRERDALVKQALELDQEATQLNTKADKQGKTVVDLQKIYDDVRANPERAKELAGKVR
jgi:hypothetical protein